MSWIKGTIATCRFELRRSLTIQRIAVSIVLALFPPAMVLLVSTAINKTPEPVIVANILMVLLAGLVTLLSLLLWATPNVHSELEGKSWIFIASRPGGRISTYFGKYIAAVFSSFAVSCAALTLCILVISRVQSFQDPLIFWGKLSLLYLIACMVYAAIFSFIGTVFFRRAMVIGVGYVLIWELAAASFPALIGKLTLRYHLQSLWIAWIDIMPPGFIEGYNTMYGAPEPVFNLTCLLAMGLFFLISGAVMIVSREYVTKDES